LARRFANTIPVAPGVHLPTPGFTLLELLVVLALATLMIGIVPAMMLGSLPGAEAKGAARHVAAGLRYARSQAITQQQEIAFVLDVEQRRYQISPSNRQYQLPGRLSISMITGQSELAGHATGTIRFFPDGSSTGGRITLAYDAREYRVDVNWLTGEVAVHD
jgi:general secretion pathway protein H